MTVPVCPENLWDRVVKEMARCILEAERNIGSAPQRVERPGYARTPGNPGGIPDRSRVMARYCRITQYDPDGSVTVREVECDNVGDPRYWEARPHGNMPFGATVTSVWFERVERPPVCVVRANPGGQETGAA